jgi:hypothetical protein
MATVWPLPDGLVHAARVVEELPQRHRDDAEQRKVDAVRLEDLRPSAIDGEWRDHPPAARAHALCEPMVKGAH